MYMLHDITHYILKYIIGVSQNYSVSLSNCFFLHELISWKAMSHLGKIVVCIHCSKYKLTCDEGLQDHDYMF